MANSGHERRPQALPGARAMKVTGLGAPVSVGIRFEACEGPVVIAALRDELIAESDAGGDDDHRQELRRMLAEVDHTPGPAESFDVLWPSALALGVLRGALGHASRRALDAVERRAPLAEVRAALAVTGASLETLEDFLTVDNGGLQDVWL